MKNDPDWDEEDERELPAIKKALSELHKIDFRKQAQNIMGFSTEALDGWVCRIYSDGTIEKIKKI